MRNFDGVDEEELSNLSKITHTECGDYNSDSSMSGDECSGYDDSG